MFFLKIINRTQVIRTYEFSKLQDKPS